jgi:two-component system nitrate/nitrite response regulator NarL
VLDILLCIQNRIYREGLSEILCRRQGFGSVRTCHEARDLGKLLVSAARNEIVLIDISGADGAVDSVAVKRAFAEADGRLVIALGLDDSDEEVLASVEAGAAAFVTKDDSIDDLVDIIHAAAKGEFRCPPRIARRMQERLVELSSVQNRSNLLGRLTQREQHILDMLTDRLSNKQIARQLGLEVSTIKNHVHNIIVKLSVRNRCEAAAIIRTGRADRPAANTPDAGARRGKRGSLVAA